MTVPPPDNGQPNNGQPNNGQPDNGQPDNGQPENLTAADIAGSGSLAAGHSAADGAATAQRGAAEKPAAAPRRRRLPWRLLLPFLALFAVIAGTLVAHAVEQPDQDDPAYLSPQSDADIGASRLAERLRERGVDVVPHTSTAGVLEHLRAGGPATVFVSTPEMADMQLLGRALLPAATRVVVVAPQAQALWRAEWPPSVEHTRWAAAAPEPGCADPVAQAAGPAAARRVRYSSEAGVSCYDGGMVTFAQGPARVTLVGAADPFRNDRLDEHGNAELATGLLAGRQRVLWLDLHERETPPIVPDRPSPRPEQTLPPRDGQPGESGDGRGADERGDEPEDGEGEGDDSGSLGSHPLARAFPPAMWATVALLLLAAIALAAAAARRLGTPVAEPLPSRIPAGETMLGHAALYQRAKARGESLDILRAAARRRLAAHFGLPPGVGVDELARHVGAPADYLREVLDGDPPRDDDELVAAARHVQSLVRDVTGNRNEGEPL